jgi:hypothetical protein
MSSLVPALRSNDAVFTPYYFSNLPGSKAHLLELAVDDLNGHEQLPWQGIPVPVTRRDAIRVGLVTGGVLLGIGTRPTSARAEPITASVVFWFVAKYAAIAAISYFVHRILGEVFPKPITNDDVRRLPNPRPSSSAFHNQFADPHVVINQDFWKEPRRLASYPGLEFGLREHLLFKDVNAPEFKAIEAHTLSYGCPLLPVDPRSEYDGRSHHKEALRNVGKLYRGKDLPDLSEKDVRYVQTFKGDVKRGSKEHLGFGVVRDGQAYLLLDC